MTPSSRLGPLLLLLALQALGPLLAGAWAQAPGGELRWSIGYDPKTLDPARVDDQASETVRFLTGGVLIRLDRSTQRPEPELAERWTLTPDGRLLTLRLRPGLRFSDGSPLTARDVAATLSRVLAPSTEAPVAEEFLSPAKITVDTPDPLTVRLHLPERIAAVENIFDEIAIQPAAHQGQSPGQPQVGAGPFVLGEYKRGDFIRLRRNPFFWKHDPHGDPLPYVASIRLDMLSNRETEQMRFVRGEYSLLDSVSPEAFDALNRRAPGAVHDLGPSLNTEQMWFNQSPSAPLPAWEKAWFTNRVFRSAISLAIQRADLARVAYAGHATPANGFISPANRVWYNPALPPVTFDRAAALRLLATEGFHRQGSALLDRAGHPVSFSILTNAGNRARERMATMIQQDLAALGIEVNVVTLDFPALIDRLMHTSDYEAALLGVGNVQPDPSAMMNIWRSSSPNHQWNPSEKVPATPWEAEIDTLMSTQAQSADLRARKRAVDRVQAIVAEQLPFLYLLYPNVICAASPSLQNVHFSILQPDVISHIDEMRPADKSH